MLTKTHVRLSEIRFCLHLGLRGLHVPRSKLMTIGAQRRLWSQIIGKNKCPTVGHVILSTVWLPEASMWRPDRPSRPQNLNWNTFRWFKIGAGRPVRDLAQVENKKHASPINTPCRALSENAAERMSAGSLYVVFSLRMPRSYMLAANQSTCKNTAGVCGMRKELNSYTYDTSDALLSTGSHATPMPGLVSS